MQRFLGIILFFIFVAGCKSDRPAHVLKEKDMGNLLMDLHLAESYVYTWSSDSAAKRSGDFIAGIYEHYNTDSAAVRESLEYYAKQPQVLNRIYQGVDSRLKAMETEIRAVEEKKYRDVFVKDSIQRALVADSLLKIKTDSSRYETLKHLLYWKNPDSATLKPKAWEWKKELVLPKQYFNYSDSLFFSDSTTLKPADIQRDSVVTKDNTAVKKTVREFKSPESPSKAGSSPKLQSVKEKSSN